jgi:O-antigen ligase
VVAHLRGGDASAAAGLLLVAAGSFVAAHWVAGRLAWLVPLLVVAAAALLAVARGATLLQRPLGNPFGYSNAVGSFYLIAAAAALMLAVRVPRRARTPALLAAVGAALVPWFNGTTTAAVLVCGLPLALLVRSGRHARLAVAAAACAMLATLSTVLVLAAAYQPGADRSGLVARTFDATLSERRLMLWNDALAMAAEHPLTGVGPTRFPEFSATARSDVDARWVHNQPLHFAAETGVPGFLLCLGLFAWGLARLWWGPGDAGSAVASLAWGAVGVQANVDYVLHFVPVAVAAAALVGAGSRLPPIVPAHAVSAPGPPKSRAAARRDARRRGDP